jgi:very-short-patch-repair endonuclease
MRTFLLSRQKINSEKLVLAKRFRKHMTPAEIVFWEMVRNNKVLGLHFRRQQLLGGFIADFFCNQIGLVVEIDGGIHEMQKDYDRERDNILAQQNLTILRFSNQELLKQPGFVKQRLEETIIASTTPSTAGKGK